VSLGRYVAIVLGLQVVLLGIGWPLGLARLEPRAQTAVLLGAAIAALNTGLAYGLVVWSSRRSTGAFLGAVLGGMVGRMGLMLGAVVALVLGADLPKLPLTFSLLTFFVLYLVLELSVLHRHPGTGTGTAVAR
jgi:hypothetical protein